MRLALAASVALALAPLPGLSVTDAERAEALRSAAKSLRGAIATLEAAAATLAEASAAPEEGAAGGGGDASATAEETDAEAGAEGGEVTFLDPLDDSPLDIPSEDVTEAVAQFHETGENPYAGDEEAIAAGEELYRRLCVACHLEDGTGRIGPSLVDDNWQYARTGTHKGQFEIIYAGGAGAMQAFSKRISQDEILKVIAYLDVLGQE